MKPFIRSLAKELNPTFNLLLLDFHRLVLKGVIVLSLLLVLDLKIRLDLLKFIPTQWEIVYLPLPVKGSLAV